MQYKALSLLQPWASLVVMGHKQIETRSFNTKYRGLLLIHASLRFNKQQTLAMAAGAKHFDILMDAGYNWRPWGKPTNFPLGAIIGAVNLSETTKFYRAQDVETFAFYSDHQPAKLWDLTEKEYAFGDYSDGRYGWMLSEPVMFKEPIPCKGNLGIWNVPEETAAIVQKALAVK